MSRDILLGVAIGASVPLVLLMLRWLALETGELVRALTPWLVLYLVSWWLRPHWWNRLPWRP